jgi:hypothetical protein
VSEVGDSSLGVVLDSLVPYFRGSLTPTPLPFFQGQVECSWEKRTNAGGSGGGLRM